jgi:hypothetical protein
MHFGDDESDDAMTQEVQRTILNEEKPGSRDSALALQSNIT